MYEGIWFLFLFLIKYFKLAKNKTHPRICFSNLTDFNVFFYLHLVSLSNKILWMKLNSNAFIYFFSSPKNHYPEVGECHSTRFSAFSICDCINKQYILLLYYIYVYIYICVYIYIYTYIGLAEKFVRVFL